MSKTCAALSYVTVRVAVSVSTMNAKVGGVDSSAGLNAARKRIASLYDLTKKFASSHENLNKLRVKLATCKHTSLVRLPPSEHPFISMY
jgi:DNA repair ATPase RecN